MSQLLLPLLSQFHSYINDAVPFYLFLIISGIVFQFELFAVNHCKSTALCIIAV